MIETTITKIQYDADGVQRRWSIPFQYADAKHISIYTKVGEEPTVKVVDNYDIDEDDSVVIYPTIASGQEPVTAGTKIIIARETPETQLEDASQVHFTSKDVERGLDKLTMITQELSTTAGETMEVSADAFEAAEEAVNSAAQANNTAEEAKTIAGQAVGIATDAKSIAEGIDAKATQALDNSNTAINTANSAKQTAEGIDDKATQALANSTTALETATEAKNTADSYQGQITTIESKIPDDATEQNQLVTKTQMETAIAGSSVDLTGYYNRDNLLGADEIEIVPEPVEGGIDEHTLACWHFDNSLLDEVSQLSIRNTSTAVFVTGKFGMAVGALYGGRPDSNLLLTKVLDVLNDWTIDCDVVINGSATDGLQLYVGGENSGSQLSAGYSPFTGSCSLYKSGTKLINTTIEKISVGEKPHFAFQKKGNNVQIFINGKKVIDYDLSSYTLSSSKGFKTTGRSAVSIDELRISDIARYTEDFEPPTKPYSVAVPTGNYVVRNKTKLVHKSDIGIANGVASLDANAKVPYEQIPVATTSALGGVKPDGTTITVTEDGTISVPASSELATKADLQDRVAKAGDTMTGNLNLNAELTLGTYQDTQADIKFSGVGGSFYQLVNNSTENATFLQLYDENARGLVFIKEQNSQPFYFDGTQPYRLLTTADLQNLDYVVERYNDGTNWYRKYKSGWLEQGGLLNVSNATVTFPKPFSVSPVTILLCNTNTGSAYTAKPTNVTSTSFVIWQYQSYYSPCYWYVCGQGA